MTAALADFLLFAALLGVSRADASLTKAADVADLSRPALRLPAVAASEPSRFCFAEDMDLLAPESTPGRFGLFGLETGRFERTYARNNPLKYVDPDGREVKYANQHLQRLYTRLGATFPAVQATLNRYTGEGKPDLFINRGDAGRDPSGGKAYGTFRADQPDVNYKATYDWANMKDNSPVLNDSGKFLLGATLLSATITIDSSLVEGSRGESNVAVHELGHAEFAARDMMDFLKLGAKDVEMKNGTYIPHDDRPLEKDANTYRDTVCGAGKDCPPFR